MSDDFWDVDATNLPPTGSETDFKREYVAPEPKRVVSSQQLPPISYSHAHTPQPQKTARPARTIQPNPQRSASISDTQVQHQPVPERFGNVKEQLPHPRQLAKSKEIINKPERPKRSTATPCATCGLLLIRNGRVLNVPQVMTPRLEKVLLVAVFVLSFIAIVLAALIVLRLQGYVVAV